MRRNKCADWLVAKIPLIRNANKQTNLSLTVVIIIHDKALGLKPVSSVKRPFKKLSHGVRARLFVSG